MGALEDLQSEYLEEQLEKELLEQFEEITLAEFVEGIKLGVYTDDDGYAIIANPDAKIFPSRMRKLKLKWINR